MAQWQEYACRQFGLSPCYNSWCDAKSKVTFARKDVAVLQSAQLIQQVAEGKRCTSKLSWASCRPCSLGSLHGIAIVEAMQTKIAYLHPSHNLGVIHRSDFMARGSPGP